MDAQRRPAQGLQDCRPGLHKVYPKIKVDMVGLDIDTKLPPTLTSGTGVSDGSFYEDVNIVGQADHLYDLSTLMEPHLADTVHFKLDVNTIDGKLVGIPWDIDPSCSTTAKTSCPRLVSTRTR